MSEILYLPVSIGEAIDKLTILDIKLEFIKDEFRKNEVKKEYDMLYEKLKDVVVKYNEYYKIMKHVNREIWFMMDILRDSKNITDEEYYKKCKECTDANDMRFRIKNKINNITNSILKEQKSYNVLRCVFDLKDNSIDMEDVVNIIKYYSYVYDEILIICDDNILQKDIFRHDTTIKIVNNYHLDNSDKFIKFSNYNSKDYLFEELNITNNIIEIFMC